MSWVVNVGNEKGKILQSVAITFESILSLKMMADGLMLRFWKHDVEPPAVLYTDRDCCSDIGPSKYEMLFSDWNHMKIRLDIWHFMRHITL